jgi:hypothetical protein
MRRPLPILAILLLLPAALARADAPAVPPLDLAALVQPYDPAVSVYADEGYHCWDPQITKGDDGRYYLVYARWRKKGGDWLTNSEICMAVGTKPDGPYKHLKVLLKGRGPGHWDELMACNSKIKKFGDKFYLYYISSKATAGLGGLPSRKDLSSRLQIRNSQRTGVAVSSALTGPYDALDAPIVEPSAPVNAVTVNPTVEQMPDGRYLMMLKGDRNPHLPTEAMGQRVEGLAIAEKPTGPFVILPELAIKDFDTEDAEMWWDAPRRKFFAVFHAHKYIGLIESADGLHWQPAEHPRVVEGNRLKLIGGKELKTEQGPLQRPGVFIENGEPRVLCLAVPMKDHWHIVTVPLAHSKPSGL